MSIQFGAQAPSLLLIFGADHGEPVAGQGNKLRITGASDISRLLGQGARAQRWYVTRQDLRQRRQPDFAPYRYLINLITEPEQNSDLLEILGKALREAGGKVINPPEAVLGSTRDQVARRLAGVPGLIAPKVVRFKTAKPELAVQMIERAGLQYPVIVRQAGTHTGRIVGLFDNAAELRAALAHGGGDHIATEFVDFRSTDGLFRKYRFFFIGKQVIFRHMLVSDEWSVHARDRMRFMLERPALREEEERLFDRVEGALPSSIIETLETIRERMKLDFFGMDCGIMPDGMVVLFEANATMNFFPFLRDPEFAYVQRCLAPAQRAFRELLDLAPAGADLRVAS